MSMQIYLSKGDMPARLRSIYDALPEGDEYVRTHVLADWLRANVEPWSTQRYRSLESVRSGVAAGIVELRRSGWLESRYSEQPGHKVRELEHHRFPRRHTKPQANIIQRGKSNNGAARTLEPLVARDTAPVNRVLAAAARIEQAVNELADALPELQDQLNTYKEIQDLAARLPRISGD